MMNYSNRKTGWYSLAFVVLASDQALKRQIDLTTPLGWSLEVTWFFNLVHVLNPGAAFSFLAGAGGWQRWFFLAIALIASVWLAWMLSKPVRRIGHYRVAAPLTRVAVNNVWANASALIALITADTGTACITPPKRGIST